MRQRLFSVILVVMTGYMAFNVGSHIGTAVMAVLGTDWLPIFLRHRVASVVGATFVAVTLWSIRCTGIKPVLPRVLIPGLLGFVAFAAVGLVTEGFSALPFEGRWVFVLTSLITLIAWSITWMWQRRHQGI